MSAKVPAAAGHVAARRTSLPRRLHRLRGWLFISPWLIAFAVFDFIPTAAAFVLSLTNWSGISGRFEYVALDNYRELLEDRLFWKSLWNTVYYTFISVPLGLAVAFVLALLLNSRIRGQTVYRTLYYLPSVVPTVAASVVWLWIFDTRRGILNYLLGLVGIPPIHWLTSPQWSKNALIIMSLWTIGGTVLIYLAGLQDIPQELYEAAEVDGANTFQKITRITIPLMTPTIFFNLVIGIIGSFQVFNVAFITTGGGPVNSTLFYMLYLYNNAFSYFRMGYASAMAVILFLLVLVLTICVYRSSGRWVHYA